MKNLSMVFGSKVDVLYAGNVTHGPFPDNLGLPVGKAILPDGSIRVEGLLKCDFAALAPFFSDAGRAASVLGERGNRKIIAQALTHTVDPAHVGWLMGLQHVLNFNSQRAPIKDVRAREQARLQFYHPIPGTGVRGAVLSQIFNAQVLVCSETSAIAAHFLGMRGYTEARYVSGVHLHEGQTQGQGHAFIVLPQANGDAIIYDGTNPVLSAARTPDKWPWKKKDGVSLLPGLYRVPGAAWAQLVDPARRKGGWVEARSIWKQATAGQTAYYGMDLSATAQAVQAGLLTGAPAPR